MKTDLIDSFFILIALLSSVFASCYLVYLITANVIITVVISTIMFTFSFNPKNF